MPERGQCQQTNAVVELVHYKTSSTESDEIVRITRQISGRTRCSVGANRAVCTGGANYVSEKMADAIFLHHLGAEIFDH